MPKTFVKGERELYSTQYFLFFISIDVKETE